MKEFIFLYPIKEYFDASLGNVSESFSYHGYDPRHLNNLIDFRYKQNNFGINWVLFSDPTDNLKPDLTMVSEHIQIESTDKVLVNGLTFAEHVSEKVYPDPAFVLNQVSQPISELVIGGFHQWDGVDKMGEYAYKSGLNVIVDEETTDLFFVLTSCNGPSPLSAYRPSLLSWVGREMLGTILSGRSDKPWFSQK